MCFCRGLLWAGAQMSAGSSSNSSSSCLNVVVPVFWGRRLFKVVINRFGSSKQRRWWWGLKKFLWKLSLSTYSESFFMTRFNRTYLESWMKSKTVYMGASLHVCLCGCQRSIVIENAFSISYLRTTCASCKILHNSTDITPKSFNYPQYTVTHMHHVELLALAQNCRFVHCGYECSRKVYKLLPSTSTLYLIAGLNFLPMIIKA